ncbi:fibronectin type III domain-containing protein [Aurantibacillus circumpalustris]|uniref:fibronectin type III domain-containing protein n=1 Tax=Aurantibacillus circumpalustris TaxID=3036359 RepID=UPI00295B07B8|nr:fibronectin type III domain-containing protein [Aurantibacillus circumpalustris]
MRFFLLTVLSVFFLKINSQSLANYSTTRNTGVTYASINLTGSSFPSWRNSTSFTQDDNRSDFTNIGFDFWYDGTRYTQFCVSTNGFLDFSSSTDDGGAQGDDFGYSNAALTTANAANATRPAIAPFYDDLTAQGGTSALSNSLKYSLSGSAPNRTLTVEWINMAVYNNVTPSLNFQVKLVEGTGKIIVHYGVMNSGNNTFSYSMGINGPTMSNTPTSAQLKELQAANGNSFSNAVQNNLSAMPAASSQYIFTPVVPTAVSGNLTFSGVSQTAITLNWPNWASNEVGYVVYNSTDGVNYDFVTQTTANATSYAATGLLPSTTYFWRLYAVTEGCLSSPLSGSQITNPAGNKVSNSTGNWNTAGIWTPNGVPTAADNVTIANGHVVSINASGQCNNLIVGQGGASTLQFSGNTNRTLVVNNNITVNNAGVFTLMSSSNATHSVTLEGNMTNNGTINFALNANNGSVDVLFDKDGTQTVSGTGATTSFNRINVSLGTEITNTLNITSSNFSAASNFLDLTAGTLKISTTNAVNITPFTAAVTVSANTGIILNASNLTVNTGAGVTLFGEINLVNGILNIGNAADEDLNSNGGTISVSGGTLNIAGKLDGSGINNICDFNISGGVVVVPTFGSTNTTIAPFHISSPGSQCNMTGGTIVIQREGGTGAQDLGFTNTGTSGAIVTGGTLQIGNGSTPAAQIMNMNTDNQIQNLVISSANVTVRLITNPLIVGDNINILSGTLNANNLGISLGGNWSNAGTYTPGTGTLTFNGSGAQTIFKSGGEIVNALTFSGSGTKTFLSPVTANSSFSISSGVTVDVNTSNFGLTVKGNFTNNGTFNARNGLLTLNGTSAQSIGGSSTTDFFDITLNNSTGASLSNAENLKGTLTLTSGAFNANGQIFTMISDATNTARIAQITGGDYLGNVTIQRFAPGGTTGWAFLGSPISSALTLNDWDDNMAISCATCPDGNAGGFLSIYTYNEAVPGVYDAPASYVPLSTINDPIVAGKGYWVYLGTGLNTTSDITLDLTGTPRKGAYSIPLNYTNSGSTADDGWNLITNPYPSPISWTALRAATSNIDNAIYVYNADLNSGTGGFASFVNGISSPAVGSGGIGNSIAMGQGFYVHSTGATALNALESNKIAANPTFLKSSSATNSQPLMRLLLKGANAYEDETVLYFEQGANDFFDEGFDSYKMRGQDPNAASIATEFNTEVFQINGIAPVTGNHTTPLKVLTGVSGNYTITADNIGSFPKGACITLFDKFTSITTDLKSSDYAFNLSDTTSVARFDLNITLNLLNINSTTEQPTCQKTDKGQIIVKGNSAGPWNYYWKLNGNIIQTSLNKSTADTLGDLTFGSFDLEINTVGMCDNNESSFTINQQISPLANFTSVDTLYLDASPSVQFTNNSANSISSYWDFGTGQDFSTSDSPLFSYNLEGTYDVNLVVTSSTGCADTAFKTLRVLSNLVGINNISATNNNFLVKSLNNNSFGISTHFDDVTFINAQIADASGKIVLRFEPQTTNNLNLEFSLNNSAKGIYYLSVTTTTGKKVVKLLVH